MTALPPIDQAALPAEIRTGSAKDKQNYKIAVVKVETALSGADKSKEIKVGIALVDYDCVKDFVDSIREHQDQVYQAFVDDINARGDPGAWARSECPEDSLAKPWNNTEGRLKSRRSISASICCGIPRSMAMVKVCGVK